LASSGVLAVEDVLRHALGRLILEKYLIN